MSFDVEDESPTPSTPATSLLSRWDGYLLGADSFHAAVAFNSIMSFNDTSPPFKRRVNRRVTPFSRHVERREPAAAESGTDGWG